MHSLTISLDTIFELTDDKLFELCQQNSEVRFERNVQGDLIIMAPEGCVTGMRTVDCGFRWSAMESI
jgi:Uma2 family endonuclease